jgi:hypothetical protein
MTSNHERIYYTNQKQCNCIRCVQIRTYQLLREIFDLVHSYRSLSIMRITFVLYVV